MAEQFTASSVKTRLRPFFLNSFSWQYSSKAFICAVTAGWVMNSSPAAAVKFKFLAA